MRAIELGLSEGAVGGHVDSHGIFRPVYPTPDDILPYKLSTKRYALEIASNASQQMRDAVGLHLAAGRDDAEGLEAFIERFDSFCGIPLIPAIRNTKTKKVFTGGVLHGGPMSQHPELSQVIVAFGDYVDPVEVGWQHFDGRYFTREEACVVAKSLTGVTMNDHRLISGEEWIPNLKDDEDAEIFGEHMHEHGLHNARTRVQIFTKMNKHIEHTRLLKIAIKIYERINKR
jgi:hypothetical protein